MNTQTIEAMKAIALRTWGDVFWMIIIFFVGRFLLRKVVNRASHLITRGSANERGEKRAKTFRSVLITTGNTLIYASIFFILLDIFGVDTKPFITGAGVIGLAIGFGSQSLVRDFMSGILVLYEGQYSVGDRVKIGGFEGEVIKITIRSTVLLGENGERVYIANGSVSNVVNLSQKPKSPEALLP